MSPICAGNSPRSGRVRFVGTQRTGDDVLRGRLLGLLERDHAAAYLLHDQRVIFGQLQQLAFAKEVDAAVADVGDAEGTVAEAGRNQRGPHAGGVLVFVRVGQDGVVGLLDRLGEQSRSQRRVFQVGVLFDAGLMFAKIRENGVDGDLAGDLARSMSAHAVAHDEHA